MRIIKLCGFFYTWIINGARPLHPTLTIMWMNWLMKFGWLGRVGTEPQPNMSTNDSYAMRSAGRLAWHRSVILVMHLGRG